MILRCSMSSTFTWGPRAERRSQGRKLIAADILTNAELEGPRSLETSMNGLGWFRGFCPRILRVPIFGPTCAGLVPIRESSHSCTLITFTSIGT
jgi:hypothetical protein